MRNTYNAATFQPYNPGEAIGDVNPTAPEPPAEGGKCGAFGQFLTAIVSVAVTLALNIVVPGSGALYQAAVAAASSSASQGFAVATGIQEKFSWNAVATAAVAAGIGGIGSKAGETGGLGGRVTDQLGINSSFVNDFVGGAINNAATQGIGVATGLQDKFSWAGVAAAGVGNAVGGWAKGKDGFDTKPLIGIGADLSPGNIGEHFAVGAVRTLANAATRSALDGSQWGDNFKAAIPDVIAQTLGGIFEGSLAAAQEAKLKAQVEDRPQERWLNADGTPRQEPAFETFQIAQLGDFDTSVLGLGNMRAKAESYSPYGYEPVDIDAMIEMAAESGVTFSDDFISELAAGQAEIERLQGVLDSFDTVTTGGGLRARFTDGLNDFIASNYTPNPAFDEIIRIGAVGLRDMINPEESIPAAAEMFIMTGHNASEALGGGASALWSLGTGDFDSAGWWANYAMENFNEAAFGALIPLTMGRSTALRGGVRTSIVDGVDDGLYRLTIDPNLLRYSQKSVKFETGDGLHMRDLIDSMRTNGWKGDPIDIVQMDDGLLTSIANRRVHAASMAGIQAQTIVRGFTELLPADYAKNLIDPKRNFYPKTYGDLIEGRINGQGAAWRLENPYGSFDLNRISLSGYDFHKWATE